MDNLILSLESEIKKFIRQHLSLRASYQQLTDGKKALHAEKRVLMEKQINAIRKLEALIQQLKIFGQQYE